MDLDPTDLQKIVWEHTTKTEAPNGEMYFPTMGKYDNYYSPGAIVAYNNKSPWSTGRKQKPLVDGKTNPFPPLKQWSDAAFLVHRDKCQGDVDCVRKLKGVLRFTITDADTSDFLGEYMRSQKQIEGRRFPEFPGQVFRQGSTGFNVALGTAGKKGVGYLLATHREALGWKEAYEIHVYGTTGGFVNVLFLIRDHQENSDTATTGDCRRDYAVSISEGKEAPPADHTELLEASTVGDKDIDRVEVSAEARAISPSAPLLSYRTATCKGALLSCRMDSPKAGVPQSKYTKIEDLQDNGWDAEPKEFEMPFYLAPIYEDLGISSSREDNFETKYEQKRAVKLDNQEYPASGARCGNLLNVKDGIIVAKSNFGVTYTGRDQDPPVSRDEAAPLKQWSDVIYLAWQQLCAEHGADIKGIKKIFRMNVINSDTENMVDVVLDNRMESLEKWPGVKIALEEDDALAILGTPNGNGAAWLLASHKEQLGVKRVTHVTVFDAQAVNGRAKPSLCFWIEDVPHEELGDACSLSHSKTPEDAPDSGNSKRAEEEAGVELEDFADEVSESLKQAVEALEPLVKVSSELSRVVERSLESVRAVLARGLMLF